MSDKNKREHRMSPFPLHTYSSLLPTLLMKAHLTPPPLPQQQQQQQQRPLHYRYKSRGFHLADNQRCYQTNILKKVKKLHPIDFPVIFCEWPLGGREASLGTYE